MTIEGFSQELNSGWRGRGQGEIPRADSITLTIGLHVLHV